MGRYIGPKNKLARRFGVHLGLKLNAAKVARRLNQAPGVHGTNRRPHAASNFGKQLIEKQKAKWIYGMRERQFHRYVREASKMEGDSGVNLLRTLELRLDNVVYRMGFAITRAQARQFVNHGMFSVNGKKIDIPSHRVKVGDMIELRKTKQDKKIFVNLVEQLNKKELPSWVTVDAAGKQGKIVSMPEEKDFERIFDVKLIIEYYSAR